MFLFVNMKNWIKKKLKIEYKKKKIVCHSHVLVCHSYITCEDLYVIRMSLVCTCMSFVCHSYVALSLAVFTTVRSDTQPWYRTLEQCVVKVSVDLQINIYFCEILYNIKWARLLDEKRINDGTEIEYEKV